MNQKNLLEELFGELPSEDTEEGFGIPLQRYWQIIQKRVWTIILTVCLGTGLGALYAFNQQDIYRAEVKIEIRTEAPRVLGAEFEPVIDPTAGSRYLNIDEYYQTQYEILRSRGVAEAVVESLQLGEDLAFLGINPDMDPALTAQAIAEADPVAQLMRITTVEPIPESQIVRVSIEHPDPDLAAWLAQAIADEYIERNRDRQLRSTNQAYDWLDAQRVELREIVADALLSLSDFRENHNIHSPSLSDLQQQLTTLSGQVTSDLIAVQAEIRALRSERRQVELALGAETLDDVIVPSVVDSPEIQALFRDRVDLNLELIRLAEANHGDNHPDVRTAVRSLEEVEAAIRAELIGINEGYNIRLSSAEATGDELDDQRNSLNAQLTALSQAEPEYYALDHEIETQTRTLSLIEERRKEADLHRQQQDVNNIEVLDAAIAPGTPVRPRRILTLAVATLLGGLFGIGLAFLLELLDSTVRTQDDVERFLGFTFLGVVPSIKEHQRHAKPVTDGGSLDQFIHRNPKSTVAECCRSIRTNLHFMSPDKTLKRILITSPSPRDGKTFNVVNLATVMAQSNQRVLIVDTDLRRPAIHHAFGMDNTIGLTDLILGEVDYDDVLLPTDISGVDILTCGPIPPNPTELMHTERFRKVIDDLDERYDRIIFDSPPVIAVADAMILANAVDGVIFVIRAGRTSKEGAKRAKNLLSAINARLLGAILNDLDLGDRAYRYHYYYSYYQKEDSDVAHSYR